jgi:hypothetical protein
MLLGWVEQRQHIEDVIDCLLRWLDEIIQAKKMLFIYTQ